MASGHQGAILHYVHRLFQTGSVAGLGEGQLLERFVAWRDEAAFEALVARHGPMVLAVCRRILRDERDVEDAFQATFLILVRRAGSIQQRELLGNWLYGVAHRVAVRARAQTVRRRTFEKVGLEPELAAETTDQLETDERSLLLDEVRRLPTQYRASVVLCHLEGLTHEQAAEHLRCPVGTVRSRLARARKLLRSRLIRRGVVVSAGAVGSMLAEQGAMGAVPRVLLHSTVKAAAEHVAGPAAVSAAVAALAEGVVKTMFLSKLKLVFGALLVVGVIATGAGVIAFACRDGRGDDGRRRAAAGMPFLSGTRAGRDSSDAVNQAVQARLTDSIKDLQKVDELIRDLEGELKDSTKAQPVREILKRLTHDMSVSRAQLELALPSKVPGRPGAPGPTSQDLQKALNQANAAQGRFNPNDAIWVEVLEALPARPLAGPHLVRNDGTINLGFYGDVEVAGLTRKEAKHAIVNHLRKYINDETLGLIEISADGKTQSRTEPADTDRVYIDDMSEMSAAGDPRANLQNQPPPMLQDRRLSDIEIKLDQLMKEMSRGKSQTPESKGPRTER
ncbi:MAG TPA: sigma-70 family RNA polymerase sigma factor [Isosphaeraceae bacterium]|jgi:RNA polymerase sigma factor (sigma-70 family)|nr:sigma-70 family RNA polymerase sigma factor [Isosphaeraceae bacterium]